MRTGTTIILTAALCGIRARLAAIFLALGNRASTFWVCASILDCFRHGELLFLISRLRCEKAAGSFMRQAGGPGTEISAFESAKVTIIPLVVLVRGPAIFLSYDVLTREGHCTKTRAAFTPVMFLK
jgi:hypothetical protein